MNRCEACGCSFEGAPLTCPQCDAEIDQPCRCDVCRTAHLRRPRHADGSGIFLETPYAEIEALDKRLSQLEAQFAQVQEKAPSDSLCAPCVSLIKYRMGVRPPFPRTAENWWAEELARLAPAGTWADLRAGIINASNKVLKLADLMEQEEKKER